jgi:hypothetical protein
MTAAPPTGRSSASPPPSRIRVEGFALSGPSVPPDPEFHAYRKDLADIALAGQVIASHYAEPMARRICAGTALYAEASASSTQIGTLDTGDSFLLLDDSLGWAWGYAGAGKRVGYVVSAALAD